MTDQQSQEEARKAAEAVLLLAEKRLASPNSAGGSSATSVGGPSSSIKRALHKAQDRVSASIESIERTAAEKMEGIHIGGGGNSRGTAATAASSAINTSEGGGESTADTASAVASSVGDVAQEASRSMKVALHRAQGSIRAVQEKVSASIDVAKQIDSSDAEKSLDGSSSTSTTSPIDTSSSGTSTRPPPTIGSPVSDMAQEASKSMKSALTKAQGSFRAAHGKMSASIESIERSAAQKLDTILSSKAASSSGEETATNSDINTRSTSKPSQEAIDAKILADLSSVSEQIELCRSMMSSSSADDQNASPDDALLIVVGYLDACSPRMVGLINAGTAGALGPEILERCLVVNDELRKTLEDWDKVSKDADWSHHASESSKGTDTGSGSGAVTAAEEQVPAELTPVSAKTASERLMEESLIDLGQEDSASRTSAELDPPTTSIEGTAWGKTTGL